MPRRTLIAAATVMMAALLISGSAHAAATPREPGRVVILLAPYMTWDDVASGPMPETRKVAGAGLVGNMNVRSGAIGAGPFTVVGGVLSLSAGANVLSDPLALAGYDVSEPFEGGTAGDAYRRIFGDAPGQAEVCYLGLPKQHRANTQTAFNNRLGALGQAVRDAGGVTAAIGNSDLGVGAPAAGRSRPAAIVAADEAGLVMRGEVSDRLLVADPAAPFGARADTPAVLSAFASATAGVSPAVPSLVVIDTGDLERAQAWDGIATAGAIEAQRREALTALDGVVGAMSRSLDRDRDLLVVLAPAVPEAVGEATAFGLLIMRGPVGSGLARTASTHRDGICTILDVPATVVDVLGVSRAPEMVGSPISGTGGGASLADRLASLGSANQTAMAVESVRMSTVNAFIMITALVLVGGALLLYRGSPDAPGPVWTLGRWLLVLMPCIPLGALLQVAIWARPPSGAAVLGVLAGAALLTWVSAMLLARNGASQTPLIAVTGATSVILVVDQWIGAPLSFGLFGYSPLIGARYYGMGNEMAGLLLGSAMVCCALAADTWKGAAWVDVLRKWAWPAIGALVIVTTTAPFLGANIGAAAWMTVGFAVGWFMLNGKRIWTWRNAATILVLVIVLVAGMASLDALGGSDTQTHLGRAVSGAEGGSGAAGLWSMIVRKAETNVRVLGRTNWTWLLGVVLLLLGYMRWRPRGEFAAMLRANPAFAAALGAALFAGLVGYFTEDSGIIIPALIMLPVGVTAMYLMLSQSSRKPGDVL